MKVHSIGKPLATNRKQTRLQFRQQQKIRTCLFIELLALVSPGKGEFCPTTNSTDINQKKLGLQAPLDFDRTLILPRTKIYVPKSTTTTQFHRDNTHPRKGNTFIEKLRNHNNFSTQTHRYNMRRTQLAKAKNLKKSDAKRGGNKGKRGIPIRSARFRRRPIRQQEPRECRETKARTTRRSAGYVLAQPHGDGTSCPARGRSAGI